MRRIYVQTTKTVRIKEDERKMKKARKGFTLVELLIVIAIIGILGSMALLSGADANNIAKATRIVDDFKIISSAMNLYYADNRARVDSGKNADGGNFTEASIVSGLAPYMRSTDTLNSTTNNIDGKYRIAIVNTSEWWLIYKLPAGDIPKVGAILKNKAASEGFKKSASNGTATDDNAYDGTESIYYKVR